MLTFLEPIASSSPEWVVLLTLISVVLPMLILPMMLAGLVVAKLKKRTRVYLRFMYLFLPWLPFAALAGLFIMSLSNLLLGSFIALIFIAVRVYFIYEQSDSNGLQDSLKAC